MKNVAIVLVIAIDPAFEGASDARRARQSHGGEPALNGDYPRTSARTTSRCFAFIGGWPTCACLKSLRSNLFRTPLVTLLRPLSGP